MVTAFRKIDLISLKSMYCTGGNLTQHRRDTCTAVSESWFFIHVVVNFLPQEIFTFPLFWGMIMYANEFETKQT